MGIIREERFGNARLRSDTGAGPCWPMAAVAALLVRVERSGDHKTVLP